MQALPIHISALPTIFFPATATIASFNFALSTFHSTIYPLMVRQAHHDAGRTATATATLLLLSTLHFQPSTLQPTRLWFDRLTMTLGALLLQLPLLLPYYSPTTFNFALSTFHSNMNYIKHLSSFYSWLHKHPELTPHHISLYMALFQTWNAAHFRSPIHVNREELMQLSRIGSVNTFIRCLKQLHDWNLILYKPSKNVYVGSSVSMITFDNRGDNSTDNTCDNSTDNTSESNYHRPSQKETEEFFKKEGLDMAEAVRFYNHYEANGWMMGKVPIKNWQAAAVNWVSRISQFSFPGKIKSLFHKTPHPKPGNLSATTRKKYNEPV